MTRPETQYGLKVPYEKSIAELVEITKNEAPICWIAYTALAYNRSFESIKALDDLLKNQDWTQVRSAIEAIGKNINGIKLEGKLIDFLSYSNRFIVSAAIKALSNLQSLKAHDKIKSLINSKNLEIQQSAIEGISNIWQFSDFDFLLDLYNHHTKEVIKKSIGFILIKHITETNWKNLFDVLRKDPITRHREWALSAANEFSNDKEFIEQFLKDKDGHIRKKAKRFIEMKST
jgi:HEAT repeat protein